MTRSVFSPALAFLPYLRNSGGLPLSCSDSLRLLPFKMKLFDFFFRPIFAGDICRIVDSCNYDCRCSYNACMASGLLIWGTGIVFTSLVLALIFFFDVLESCSICSRVTRWRSSLDCV